MSWGDRRPFRLVLVGDEGVGKTSLVSALSTCRFEESLPPVIEHAVPIYRSGSGTDSRDVVAHAIDTSCAPGKRAHLERHLRDADVVCVVCDANRPETLSRVESLWLPEIRRARTGQAQQQVPVIVVANRADLSQGDGSDLEPAFTRLIEGHREVESCLSCSARQLLYLPKLVESAQRAVLHPLGPLYELSTARMTPACIRALTRVFKLLDHDKDGSLNDAELNSFQKIAYENSEELNTEELQELKRKVARSQADGVDDNGLTLSGFLFLHHKLCQRNKADATWRLLYSFGYDKSLEISDSFLLPSIVVSANERVELSDAGWVFLEDLFRRHDKDKDGALCDSELQEMFSVTPGFPWRDGFPAETAHINVDGNLTLRGFISQWVMTTLVNYKITLHYLAYFGFQGDTRTAIKCTRADPTNSKMPERSSWLCYVFGSRGCGKTAVLRGLLEKDFCREYLPTTTYLAVCNTPDTQFSHRHLAMMEFANEDDVVHDAEAMKRCDVACLLHDANDPTSFAHVLRLHQHLMRHYPQIPCVHFVAKSDLAVVTQLSSKSPSQFLSENRLPAPIRISMREGVTEGMYTLLISAAENPAPYRTRHSRMWSIVPRPKASDVLKPTWKRALIIGITTLTILLTAFGLKPLGRVLQNIGIKHPAMRCWWWMMSLRTRLSEIARGSAPAMSGETQ